MNRPVLSAGVVLALLAAGCSGEDDAADYERSWELLDELATNPTLENLDARVAMFSAPGSENFTRRKAFFEELVATGERVIPASRTTRRSTSSALILRAPRRTSERR